jgi:hypothetical protein
MTTFCIAFYGSFYAHNTQYTHPQYTHSSLEWGELDKDILQQPGNQAAFRKKRIDKRDTVEVKYFGKNEWF